MTTIVADQKMGFLAADRMATSNDCEVACEYPKIREVEIDGEVHLIASSGYEGPATMFEEWYAEGAWDEPLEYMALESGEEFTSVILTPTQLLVADKFMRPYPIHSRWYATGTGGAFAWAVLVAGCGIDLAMKTALKMDPNSGFGYDIKYLSDYEP